MIDSVERVMSEHVDDEQTVNGIAVESTERVQ